MPRYLIGLLSLTAMVLLAACDRRAVPTSLELRRLDLDRPGSQLGEQFTLPELRFSFNAPVDWARVPDSELPEPPEDSELFPIAAFRHPDTNATCVVLKLRLATSVSDYVQIHRRSFSEAQVLNEELTVNGVQLTQIRIIDRASIVFKNVVLDAGVAVVEVDYVVPRAIYPDFTEPVDASIGSIRLGQN